MSATLSGPADVVHLICISVCHMSSSCMSLGNQHDIRRKYLISFVKLSLFTHTQVPDRYPATREEESLAEWTTGHRTSHQSRVSQLTARERVFFLIFDSVMLSCTVRKHFFSPAGSTRLYREPTSKSNRSIILNAVEYVVFPGAVNRETRERVLDIIDRCDCPHFLLLFRDQKCQFRGLYAYYPDTDEVYKIYGTGPKQVTDNMFELFFK
jgi:hypothetical protein